MDWRTLCEMKFILSLLCMRIVASSKQYKHTKSCIKRLEENNRAYNPSKKTAQYSIFRPSGNILSFQEIVESYQAVNSRLASNTMLTIITIRKRNRNIPDDKNANMLSFITALQKYNTDKKAISFVVNNMIVTINTVEQSYLPGLCMIRNTSEQIRQAYVKLNLIFIDTLPELLFTTYVSLIIDWIHFYGRVMSKDLKLDGKNAEDRIKAIDTYHDNNYEREFNNMKNRLFRMFDHDDIEWSLSRCAPVVDSMHLSLQLFEKNYSFAYLTKHKKDFIVNIKYLVDHPYKSLLLEFMNEIFKKGFSTMEHPVHEQESKNAFMCTLMLFLADMGQENPINYCSDSTGSTKSNSTESSESKSTKSKDVKSVEPMTTGVNLREKIDSCVYKNYFKEIGFDSLQADFLKSKKDDFEQLRKRLAYQDSTKIVIEGKYSNDDVYSLCSALDSANAFSELDKCQALYLYKEKPIEVKSDDRAYECERNKLRTDANTSKSVLADETHKANAIDTAHECDNNAPIQNKYSLVISVAKKNVFYSEQGALRIDSCKEQSAIESSNSTDSMPEEVKKLLSQCLDKSNRKSTELCEITAESEHFVSHVHILNYISIDEKEITSLIYDIQDKGQMTKGTSKENLGRSLICLDDVPTVFLENVLNDIRKLQLTGATEIKPSNMLTVGCQRIIYHKNYLWFRELDKLESLVPRIYDFLDKSCTQHHFPDQFEISHLDMTNETFDSHMDDTRTYLRRLEFDNSAIDTIISQVKQNIDFIQRELNDSCVINRHESDIYINCYTTCEPDKSMILHICASQKNESVGTSVDFAIKTLENVLNNEKNMAMIETVDLIEQQMMLKQKIIPTIIDNMCRQKNFDVSLTRTRSKKENLCLTEIRHNIESLFGYPDEWAKANGSNDRFSGKLDFIARLKSLIEPRIEEIVKAIFDAKYELNNQALVILSFKICKRATLGGSNALVDDASCKNDVIYASLKHLEASEELFTKNKDGIYKCL